MAGDLQFALLELVMMRQTRNCFRCVFTMINLLLVSCPIVLFRRAKTTEEHLIEEHLIAVLVLIGCFFFLAVVDAVGIVIADDLAEITDGGMHHERAERELSAQALGRERWQ